MVVIMNEGCKLRRGTVEFQTCWTKEKSEDDAFQEVRKGKEKRRSGIPE